MSDDNWWYFWDPRSGALGGLIAGVILVLLLGLFAKVTATELPIPGKTPIGGTKGELVCKKTYPTGKIVCVPRSR